MIFSKIIVSNLHTFMNFSMCNFLWHRCHFRSQVTHLPSLAPTRGRNNGDLKRYGRQHSVRGHGTSERAGGRLAEAIVPAEAVVENEMILIWSLINFLFEPIPICCSVSSPFLLALKPSVLAYTYTHPQSTIQCVGHI